MNGNWTAKTDLAPEPDEETPAPEQGTPPPDETVARADSLPPEAQSAASGAIPYAADSGQGSADNAAPGGIIGRNIVDAAAAAPPKSQGNLKVAAELQAVVNEMKDKSKVFNDLANALDASERPYNLGHGQLPPNTPSRTDCNAFVRGCTTTIDPRQLGNTKYMTEKGGEAYMTLQRAIAYELSRSLYHEQLAPPLSWIEPRGFIIDNENKIMNQVDVGSPNRHRNDDSIPR